MVLQLITPNTYDVLMGQSPNLRLHPGNLRLKELVAERFEEYFDDRTSKLDKTLISRNIIQTIEQRGRFLKQPQKKRIANPGDSVWVLETDPVRIRDKVASQFRGHLKEQKRKNIDQNRQKRTDESCPRLRGEGDKHSERNNAPLKEVVRNLPLKKRKVELSYCDFKEEFKQISNEFNRAKRLKVEQDSSPTKKVDCIENIQSCSDVSTAMTTSATESASVVTASSDEVLQENPIENVRSLDNIPTPAVSMVSDELFHQVKAIDILTKFHEFEVWSRSTPLQSS